MAMRMPPQVAQQPVLPEVNRTSLVFFAGLSLILLQFYWSNGPKIVTAVFHSNLGDAIGSAGSIYVQGMWDALLQVLGLLVLVGLAQYGGENAGTAALLFIGALWALWLLSHFGTHPASEKAITHTEANPQPNQPAGSQGGQGGQKM